MEGVLPYDTTLVFVISSMNLRPPRTDLTKLVQLGVRFVRSLAICMAHLVFHYCRALTYAFAGPFLLFCALRPASFGDWELEILSEINYFWDYASFLDKICAFCVIFCDYDSASF